MSCLGPIHRAQARCQGCRHARLQQPGAPGFWPLRCTLGGFGARALMVCGQFGARPQGEGELA